MYQTLIAAASGAEIITPTQRLSKHLQHCYVMQSVQQNRATWHSPDILAWTSWCEREWQELSFSLPHPALLLNDMQQYWIWQRIIQSSDLNTYCLSSSSTARLAVQSYKTIRAARIKLDWQASYLNDNTSAFKAWQKTYAHHLQEQHLIDSADLPDLFRKHARQDKDRCIIFYGFHAFTPQQRRLIQSLRSVGITVQIAKLVQQNQKKKTLVFSDIHAEIKHVACWAKQRLNDAPGAKIGIISLDLDAQRTLIQSAFDLILHPQSLLTYSDSKEQAYALSLGRTLQYYPLIHIAMHLLALADEKIPLSRISALLLSPYLTGANEERSARALFDARLRQYGEQQLTLKTLFWVMQTQCSIDAKCPIFIEQLKRFEQLLLAKPRRQSFHLWSKTFSDWLVVLGWLQHYPLDSNEYQLINAWQKALRKLSSLAQISTSVSYAAAFTQLLHIVCTQRFQAETTEMPIQVIGTNGAAGMQFDYVWMLGVHDRVWPPPANPDPFIPFELQVQAKVASATSQGQYDLAHQVSTRIIRSSKQAIFSYPLQQDNWVLHSSPLAPPQDEIKDVLFGTVDNDYRERVFHSQSLVYFVDDVAPVIAKKEQISGGASIFKDQAACPFKAFAKHRLGANSLQLQRTGLDRALRGILLHKILQQLWQKLETSDKLQQSSAKKLAQLVHSVVSTVIKRQIILQPETFTVGFAKLEQQRLIYLVIEWLALEKRRAPFTVQATEVGCHVAFGGIKFIVRIDRIDELADGSLAIIDYKTGAVSAHNWEEELQLPLYVMIQKGRVAAAFFAAVKRGEMRFIGVADQAVSLPDMKRIKTEGDWDYMTAQWHSLLFFLATGFRNGDARVAPKHNQVCQYCDLPILCRINEQNRV